jgi:hypothetical protein
MAIACDFVTPFGDSTPKSLQPLVRGLSGEALAPEDPKEIAPLGVGHGNRVVAAARRSRCAGSRQRHVGGSAGCASRGLA